MASSCGDSSGTQFFHRIVSRRILAGWAIALGLWIYSGQSAELGKWATITCQAQPSGAFQWTSIPSSDLLRSKTPAKDGSNPTPLFRAWVSPQWPPGLVPIFAIEKDDRWELRRKPLKGQENFSNPIFFALPRKEEVDTKDWVGRWDLVATNATGTTHHVAMEWIVEDGHLGGRLDQNTDYRFAFLHDGFCRSNRVELKIDYIQDHYILTGERRGSKLVGTWAQTDHSDGGHWVAERPRSTAEKAFQEDSESVPLYEWKRRTDDLRWYGTQKPVFPDAGLWERTETPLCRVWRVDSQK